VLILAKDSLKTVLGIWLQREQSCPTPLEIQSFSLWIHTTGLENLDPYICLSIRIIDSWFTAEASFNLNSCIPPVSLLLPVPCIFRTGTHDGPPGHKAVPQLMLEQTMRRTMRRASQITSGIWKNK